MNGQGGDLDFEREACGRAWGMSVPRVYSSSKSVESSRAVIAPLATHGDWPDESAAAGVTRIRLGLGRIEILRVPVDFALAGVVWLTILVERVDDGSCTNDICFRESASVAAVRATKCFGLLGHWDTPGTVDTQKAAGPSVHLARGDVSSLRRSSQAHQKHSGLVPSVPFTSRLIRLRPESGNGLLNRASSPLSGTGTIRLAGTVNPTLTRAFLASLVGAIARP